MNIAQQQAAAIVIAAPKTIYRKLKEIKSLLPVPLFALVTVLALVFVNNQRIATPEERIPATTEKVTEEEKHEKEDGTTETAEKKGGSTNTASVGTEEESEGGTNSKGQSIVLWWPPVLLILLIAAYREAKRRDRLKLFWTLTIPGLLLLAFYLIWGKWDPDPKVLYYGKWLGGALAIVIGSWFLSKLFRRRGTPATAPTTPRRATGVSRWGRILVSLGAVLFAFALFNAIFWWISPGTWATAASEQGNFSIAFWASQALGVVVTTFLLATTKISDGYKKTRDVALFGIGFLLIALIIAYIPPGRAWEKARELWSELSWPALSAIGSGTNITTEQRTTTRTEPAKRRWASTSYPGKVQGLTEATNLLSQYSLTVSIAEEGDTLTITTFLEKSHATEKITLRRTSAGRFEGKYRYSNPSGEGEMWLERDNSGYSGEWRGTHSNWQWVPMEIRPR